MELTPSYKQTEVGLIPEDWRVTTLAGICSMKSGEGITSADIDQFSEYPCYGGNGLRGYARRFTHDGKHALIGRQGALCGNVMGVEGKFFASEHAVVVTALAQTNIDWLTYVLGTLRLNRYSESSAQPGLSVAKVLKLGVASPPTKAEQEAIAEALSDADALIESLDELLAKKRDLKMGVMEDLLTGKRRLPGFDGDWEVNKLSTVLRFQVGCPFSSVGFNTDGQGLRLVKNGDLKGDGQVTHYTGNYSPEFLVSNGDVLVGMDGDFVTCLWTKGPALLNQRIGRVVPRAGLNRLFSFYFLTKPLKEIEYATSGTTVKHLSHGDVEGIEKPLPSVQEQSAIAAFLGDIDAELDALEAQLGKARGVKQGMMQALLTGRVRLI